MFLVSLNRSVAKVCRNECVVISLSISAWANTYNSKIEIPTQRREKILYPELFIDPGIF